MSPTKDSVTLTPPTKPIDQPPDPKLAAFTAVAAAVTPLGSKADQYAVLSAAAKFFGFTLGLDE